MMNIEMQMIQFASMMMVIQMKSNQEIGSKKRNANQGFEHPMQSQDDQQN
jgi:hypothetical protein